MKDVRDYYNDTVEDWANEWYGNKSMLPYLKKFKSYLKENPRVLDLGCNCGYESMRMNKLGVEVVGLDFSGEAIKYAKLKNPNIRFVCDDMLNDLKYLGQFDGIMAIASLIHIPNDLDKVYERINDILKENGYLFIVVRSEEGKIESASLKKMNGTCYDRNVYGFTKEQLEKPMKNRFSFVEELPSNDLRWKYYIYKK